MVRPVFLSAAGVAALFAGCNTAPPLTPAHRSADALGTAILDSLARNDRASLDALALSEREFRDHVWPDLPAARPERNLPFSYVWGDLHQKSRISLSNALGEHGHKRYELRRVTFDEVTPYSHYVVHRDTTLHAVDASGAELALRVCGSFIEKDGVWKVFSYVVD